MYPSNAAIPQSCTPGSRLEVQRHYSALRNGWGKVGLRRSVENPKATSFLSRLPPCRRAEGIRSAKDSRKESSRMPGFFRAGSMPSSSLDLARGFGVLEIGGQMVCGYNQATS